MYALDLNPIEEDGVSDLIQYRHCDVTNWKSLSAVFNEVGRLDIGIPNAGVSQECDYFADSFDADGNLEEPKYAVMEVNYRAVLNFVKLSLSTFRRQGHGGSLVITSSATAYSPEESLPVYSATKLAVFHTQTIRQLRTC